MFRSLTLAVAVTPVAFLAACSSGTSAPAETLPAKVDVQVNAVASLKFDKSDYGTVKAGNVVFGYSNQDSVRHTLIIARDNTKVPNFKLVIPEKGANDSGTVSLEAGTYTLLCDVPGHSNMKATLTVEP